MKEIFNLYKNQFSTGKFYNAFKNRFSVTIVVMILLITLFSATTSYAVTDDEYFAGNQLKQIGILKGYADGSLKLDQPIVRSEVATIMVRIRGYENKDIALEGKEFTDVSTKFWAYKNIQNAFKLNLISGYPDATFKPENFITYAEVVTIMVNTLGYKDVMTGEWPTNYLEKAKAIGVIPKTSTVDPNKVITRGEMSLIVWDTLLALVENTEVLE